MFNPFKVNWFKIFVIYSQLGLLIVSRKFCLDEKIELLVNTYRAFMFYKFRRGVETGVKRSYNEFHHGSSVR